MDNIYLVQTINYDGCILYEFKVKYNNEYITWLYSTKSEFPIYRVPEGGDPFINVHLNKYKKNLKSILNRFLKNIKDGILYNIVYTTQNLYK